MVKYTVGTGGQGIAFVQRDTISNDNTDEEKYFYRCVKDGYTIYTCPSCASVENAVKPVKKKIAKKVKDSNKVTLIQDNTTH